MNRRTGPAWRVVGSAASWLLFSFGFTLLLLNSATIAELGGFCAQGGAHFIQIPCPDSVLFTVPLAIFTGLAAVGVGVLLAGGFGTPLLPWAWPILFVGLGVGFLVTGSSSGASALVMTGVLFVMVGGVPLVAAFRAGAQRLILGSTNAVDVRFIGSEQRASRRASQRHPDSEERIAPTLGDWVLSIAVVGVGIGLGVYFANQVYAALGG